MLACVFVFAHVAITNGNVIDLSYKSRRPDKECSYVVSDGPAFRVLADDVFAFLCKFHTVRPTVLVCCFHQPGLRQGVRCAQKPKSKSKG